MSFNVSTYTFPPNVFSTPNFTANKVLINDLTAYSLTIPYSGAYLPGSYDAFNRLRISSPFTLFDSSFLYEDNGKFDTSTSSGGAAVFDDNASIMNMNVTTASGSQVIRQSYRTMAYQPGKSLLIMCSFVMNSGKSNLRQRVGYFDDNNGIYVEQNGTTVNMVIRSKSSGVVTEDIIPQNLWNADKLDGTGYSGYTLDISKSQIFFCDVEWLGVGTVRTGFVINGNLVVCNIFNHANIINSTYMTTACLPVRYEITNLNTTSSSSTLKQVCSTVISEGGYEAFSRFYNYTLGLSSKTLTTGNVIYPIISIRLRSDRPNAIVLPSELEVLVTNNNTVQYLLLLNPTLSSPSFTNYTDNVQVDTTASGLTGGTILKAGYIVSTTQSRGSETISDVNQFNIQLGRFLNGTSDVVTLAARGSSNGATVLADLGWFEIN